MWLLVLLSVACAKVVVVSPQALKNEMQSRNPGLGEVRASLGNFGNPPYGTEIVGRVFYSTHRETLCEPPLINFYSEPDTESVPILMALRGNCTFSVKARYAENAGAKALLVLDNTNENVNSVIMSDSGFGGNIQIPSFLISKSDGEEIKRYITKLSEEVIVRLSFEVQKRDVVVVNVWFSPNEKRAENFLAEFSTFAKFEKTEMELETHYALWNCRQCFDDGFRKENADCISGGRYCAPDPDGVGPAKGRDVVFEDLRQICILNVTSPSPTYSPYFDYHRAYNSSCLPAGDFSEPCSISAMRDAGINSKSVLTCVANSFEGDDPALSDNSIMRWEKVLWTTAGPGIYPAITINSVLYRGDWEGMQVAKTVCVSFVNRPKMCEELEEMQKNAENGGISTGMLVVILAVILLTIIATLVGYRLYLKRELSQSLSQQVTVAVSQYRALGGESELSHRTSSR